MSENSNQKCVLLYEDDPEISLLCKTLLLKSQYRVAALSKCENVINDIESIQPDLILMDLWIPEIGGEKAISLIKENPATASIPVLIFSANPDIKEMCDKVNADGYVEKPFDIHILKAMIEKHI